MIEQIHNNEEYYISQLYKLLYQVWYSTIDYCKHFFNINEFITFNQLKEAFARRRIYMSTEE
jgi:hypothetical protein